MTHGHKPGTITQNLRIWAEGERSVEAELFRETYQRLKRIARNQLWSNPPVTLTPTEAVHEAYSRLIRAMGLNPPQDREAFYRLAADVIRKVCIDYLRAKSAMKRTGAQADIRVENIPGADDDLRLLPILEAIEQLQMAHPRPAFTFQSRCILGFTKEETAELMALSQATVARDLQFARHWLASRLQ